MIEKEKENSIISEATDTHRETQNFPVSTYLLIHNILKKLSYSSLPIAPKNSHADTLSSTTPLFFLPENLSLSHNSMYVNSMFPISCSIFIQRLEKQYVFH